MLRSFALLTLLAPAPLFAADDAAKAGTPVAGVGIVSPDAKLVFVPAKGGGIEALDVATGKPVWKSTDAPKLAGADANRVYGWVPNAKKANEFTVVAIDAATGKTLGKAGPILLPEWVVTEKAYGRTFLTAVRADGDGAIVAWTASAFYAGGARPTPQMEAAARKEDGRLVKLDFATGKVTPMKEKLQLADLKYAPAGSTSLSVAGLTLEAKEDPNDFGPPREGRHTIVTLSAQRNNRLVWSREIAGNPHLPPLP